METKKPDQTLILAKSLANDYFIKDKVDDFALSPTHAKLTLLQHTPKNFIMSRAVGGIQVPYIPHEYAEKCLNFIFNFQVSNEVVESKIIDTKSNGKECYEAEAMVKFTFGQGENKIMRTVYSSHRGYPNPATTRGDALKSAISKSWTVVARTFGIGSNLVADERKAYRKVEEVSEAQVMNTTAPQPKKFTPPIKKF